jgi:hypothetical protein
MSPLQMLDAQHDSLSAGDPSFTSAVVTARCTANSPNALRVLRHDNIVEVVRRALRRRGVASSKEPLLADLHCRPVRR